MEWEKCLVIMVQVQGINLFVKLSNKKMICPNKVHSQSSTSLGPFDNYKSDSLKYNIEVTHALNIIDAFQE